jgi:adenylate cyclase
MVPSMPTEIERKFLVRNDGWRSLVTCREWHRQGYLSKLREGTVRVRRTTAHATLTIKGPRRGCARQEFEYAIPLDHADEMLRTLCVAPLIEKVRHWATFGGMVWEIDEYCGAAKGLVLAEVELERPDQPFVLPDWVGREVTHDKRYRNLAIARAAARKRGEPPPKGRRPAPRTSAPADCPPAATVALFPQAHAARS